MPRVAKPKPIKERTKKVRQFMGLGRRTKVHEEALVFDDVLAMTSDGCVIHVPTGRNVSMGAGGHAQEGADDRKLILHLIEADREAWRLSRVLEWGDVVPTELRLRMIAAIQSYPGD